MINLSFNKESLSLKKDFKYVLIDALYCNDIKGEVTNLDKKNTLMDIRARVFPFTDTPFAEFIPKESRFEVSQIRKKKIDEFQVNQVNVFSSDTGLLIVISERIFISFILKFDFEMLTDSITGLINVEYWNSLIREFDPQEIAIILSPGVNSQIDFDGSGLYEVS